MQWNKIGSMPMIPVLANVFEHPPRPGSIIDTSSITPLPQPEYLQSTRTFLSY